MTPSELRQRWRNGDEVALLDAREEAPFADAHPFFAVCLPLSQVELRAFDLMPRKSVPVVVYDGGEGLASRVAGRLGELGYSDVSLLEGGLEGYAREGQLFRDVNVPSKSFGELVESTCHTPSLSAPEVKALIDEGADLAVLDVRRFEEFRTMSIPTGLNVPNAELTLRVFDLVPSPDTLVIVNCAGRTRSIIGTQTLINAGLPNRVAALRNGTIGWTLEGYGLESGRTSTFASEVRTSEARAKAAANRWAARVGVRSISRATLNTWIAEATSRTVYLLDVRTPAEHAAGHPSGFRSAPGGQLVQATDEWIAVRGARIVLFDDAGVRAQMTASWLVQMGWEAVVLEPDAVAANETGLPSPNRPPWPQESIDACAPAQLVLLNAEIVDLASSAEYAKGHIPRASFVLRSRFAEDLPRLDKDGPARRPLVLTSPDGVLARYAAAEAAAASGRPVYVLTGGTNAWVAAGFPVEQDACDWVSPAIDRYRRPYEGTDNSRDAMQAYIDWELQLVAQLAVDGVSRFRVVTPV